MSERKGEREVTCVDSANILRKLPIFPVNVKLAQFADAILKPVKQADPEATLAVCKMLCSLCVCSFGLFMILRIRRMLHGGTSDGALNALNCRTDVRVVLSCSAAVRPKLMSWKSNLVEFMCTVAKKKNKTKTTKNTKRISFSFSLNTLSGM